MQSRTYLFFPVAVVAALLSAGLLAPLPSAAQATETPTPSVTPAATESATATETAAATEDVTTTATPTVAATGTPTATLAATLTGTATPEETATLTPTVEADGAMTATATVVPAGTAATTVEAGDRTATVRTSEGVRLRVRGGPGSQYPIVARLANGQRVPLLARDQSSRWLLVSVPGSTGLQGWVSATYVATSTPIAQLPISDVTTSPAAVGTSTPAPKANVTPNPGPLQGKIAVPVFDPDEQIYNIWMVDANGENLRLVVSNASSPDLSEDGTLLAYRHWQRDDRGIVVAGSNGANALRVTDKLEDVLPSFSPDNSKVVFSTYRQGDRLSRIYYVWTDEQNQRAWEWGAGGLFGEDPDWMADGRIVFHTTGEADRLWVMNGDATGQRAFFSTPSIAAIAAAPDSSAVAYMGDSGKGEGAANWDIYTVDLQGENSRRLTDDPARDGLPAWSPDGQSIAFVSDRSGQWALWVMDADGGNQRMLALLPGPVDGRVQFEPDYLNHGWLEEQIAWSR